MSENINGEMDASLWSFVHIFEDKTRGVQHILHLIIQFHCIAVDHSASAKYGRISITDLRLSYLTGSHNNEKMVLQDAHLQVV